LEDHLPGNYSLTFSNDRSNSILDDFQSTLDIAKRSGVAVPTGTVYQYIRELDGSTSTYQFNEVTFQVTELGNFKGDDKVTQTLMASATERRRV
jgi:hypothetical protein